MIRKKLWFKIIVIVVCATVSVASIIPALTFLLYTAWSTTNRIIPFITLLLVGLLYFFVWLNILYFIIKEKVLPKKFQFFIILPLVICTCVWGGYKLYESYENSFDKLSTEVDLEQYQPFKSNLLASLDHEASLKMEEPLLTLDGATAFYPVYAAFTQAIYPEKEYHPYFDSLVSCSTTPGAYENLRKKTKDVIFVFEPSKEQKVDMEQANENMQMTPIGKESFVFFVNHDNPVDNLTTKQIQDIYSGKITNWKEVGGKDETIKAYQRPEGSGSQTALLKIMGNVAVMQPIEEDVAEGMGTIISQTAAYQNRENAIGYSFRFFAEEMIHNKKIKLLKIDGVEPNIKNIREDKYPFILPFYAIHLESNKNEKIDTLLEWITSNEGKELIEKSGYVAY